MFRDHESSPTSADNSKYQELTLKWLVLVRCVFPKKLFLDKGTHILYLVYYNYHGMHIQNNVSIIFSPKYLQSNVPTTLIVENIKELKVDEDCVQLCKFVQQNLCTIFDGNQVFYEFTREEEDIQGDTEVVLMHLVSFNSMTV